MWALSYHLHKCLMNMPSCAGTGPEWSDANNMGVIYNQHIIIKVMENVTRRYLKTLNVWGPRYLGLAWSISWLLMPWLLTSPGHQQPWYWLCRICRYWSYLRKDFKYLRHINVEQWHKMKIYVFVPSEKCSMQRVNRNCTPDSVKKSSIHQWKYCCIHCFIITWDMEAVSLATFNIYSDDLVVSVMTFTEMERESCCL